MHCGEKSPSVYILFFLLKLQISFIQFALYFVHTLISVPVGVFQFLLDEPHTHLLLTQLLLLEDKERVSLLVIES